MLVCIHIQRELILIAFGIISDLGRIVTLVIIECAAVRIIVIIPYWRNGLRAAIDTHSDFNLVRLEHIAGENHISPQTGFDIRKEIHRLVVKDIMSLRNTIDLAAVGCLDAAVGIALETVEEFKKIFGRAASRRKR